MLDTSLKLNKKIYQTNLLQTIDMRPLKTLEGRILDSIKSNLFLSLCLIDQMFTFPLDMPLILTQDVYELTVRKLVYTEMFLIFFKI